MTIQVNGQIPCSPGKGCSQALIGPGLNIGCLWEYHCQLEDTKYTPYVLVAVRGFVEDVMVL